jgi:deoxyribodipyrimidine photolyase-related protein
VEWVELPNVAGMALHANGGRFTSKPYAAGGAYVDRMSNYCAACRYRPRERSGPRACPFTVLYWRFLDRNLPELAANPRTAVIAASVERMGGVERARLRELGDAMLARIEDL